MIICKTTTTTTTTTTGVRGGGVIRVTGVTRGDGTAGGEGKGGEQGEEGGAEGREEILAHGRADRPIKGSTRGPRGPKKTYDKRKFTFFCAIFKADKSQSTPHRSSKCTVVLEPTTAALWDREGKENCPTQMPQVDSF